MSLTTNGNTWSTAELAMLIEYDKVSIEHLAVLIPTQTAFDIERKKRELSEAGITDIKKLGDELGEVIEW